MVDRDLVLRKLADLDLYVGQVSEYREIGVDEYRRDWKTQRIVERTLQMAIEVCVDVANHVIADRTLRVPATYAGFRNVVVHEYARVDAEIVVRILREHLDDLARFGATAHRWVATAPPPG